MPDRELIEEHSFERIPVDRDLYLMDEKWMPAYKEALITLFRGGEYDNIGYISYAAARAVNLAAVELSWYPNIYDRFHEVRVILPRSEFVACTECWQYDEKPRIFVRSNWLTRLHLQAYSVFALIDVIDIKKGLANGKVTRPKLIALREKIDEISARNTDVAFISFADSLLLKSNWFVGQWDSNTSYTYDPEAVIKLLPEINAAYYDILGLSVYTIITQGSNEYCYDGLLHISAAQNHVSLNSLGFPFAQLWAIEGATRKAIRDGEHAPAEIYMDEDFFRSLRFDHNVDKGSRSKYEYPAPMSCRSSHYFLDSRQKLLDSLRPPEELE
jgi:hypothetical protein